MDMIDVAETPPLRVKLRDLLHVASRLITSNPENYYLLLVMSLSTRQATVSCDITVTQCMYSMSFRWEKFQLLQ